MVDSESNLKVVKEKIVGRKQGPSVSQGGVNSPLIYVNLPVEMLEKVDDGFEWVVGSGFGLNEPFKEEFDGELFMAVEEEMFSECCKGVDGDSRERVCFAEIGCEQECEVPFSC